MKKENIKLISAATCKDHLVARNIDNALQFIRLPFKLNELPISRVGRPGRMED